MKESDYDLINAYCNGCERSFQTLVNKYKDIIYTKIFMIVKNEFVAEDLMQETFIKAIDMIKAGKYNEEGKFLPWIIRIGQNKAIDWFRRSQRYPEIELEEKNGFSFGSDWVEDSFEVKQIRKDTVNKVRELIDRLPENQKEVLKMRSYMDMSFQEISEQTGVSINTALGRMRYALMNLRKMMDEEHKMKRENLFY
ncbi:RNA polymerase sigma factor [Aureibacter tunicatorum]|uniref:RNA polymerase sigma-70 factor (ECF subfamily) n=1 Tax=Aureibacter tunicatorum TaxID=866807 RepID=A0AAE3XQY5_9BACT|nr:sigma-70 family RNA polymerase sigma factor [Aureibacter tunicatorum]MDR6241040.1 RNA polymerase sigma-70 factor (ECF subfamily) [Aureibacter tunicatorum]BDD03818.1 RNA polymerase subunit sigma-24 [Aureibacter tunicatorum]